MKRRTKVLGLGVAGAMEIALALIVSLVVTPILIAGWGFYDTHRATRLAAIITAPLVAWFAAIGVLAILGSRRELRLISRAPRVLFLAAWGTAAVVVALVTSVAFVLMWFGLPRSL